MIKSIVPKIENFYYFIIDKLINYIINRFPSKILVILSKVQIDPSQPARMRELKILLNKLSSKSTILEIGTWMGEGSTKVIYEYCPSNSTILLLDYYQPYTSRIDIAKLGPLSRLARADIHQKLAFYNSVKMVSGYQNLRPDLTSITIKGDSRIALAKLKENSIDLIYIDGSHYYRDVKSDIKNAKKIIKKDYGIICGDDLERYPDNDLIKFSKNKIEEDMVNGFHPGVLLAVAEEFTQGVNMKSGFWWVFAVNGNFQTSG